jgi:hypothetical protein
LLPTTSSQLLAQIFYQGVLSTLSLNVPALVDDWLHCPSTKHVNNMPISTIIQKKKKKKIFAKKPSFSTPKWIFKLSYGL